MFLRMTGLECPGCGALRMAHALLHGDLRSAWEYNSFLLLMLPLLAFMAWLETRRKRLPKLYAGFYSLPVIVGIARIGGGLVYREKLHNIEKSLEIIFQGLSLLDMGIRLCHSALGAV